MSDVAEKYADHRRLFGWLAFPFLALTRLADPPIEVESVPPGLRLPVCLRLETTDVVAFEQVFLQPAV